MRHSLLLSGIASSFFLGATASAAPPAASVAGFTMGHERAMVVARLGVRPDQLRCERQADASQQCTLRDVEVMSGKRFAVEGVNFANWTFTFADARLVGLTATGPMLGNDGVGLLVRLTNTLGQPTIKQQQQLGRTLTEARWRLGDTVTLSYAELVADPSPLSQRATLQVLRLVDDARGPLPLARDGN